MARCCHLAITATLLLGGCIYHAREKVDQSVCAITCHPYDQQPSSPAEPLHEGERVLTQVRQLLT